MGIIMLDYLETIKSKGRLYHYYRRNKQRIKLPCDTQSKEFMDAYRRAHDSFETGADEPIMAGSVTALIVAYKKSPSFTELKPRVQELYRNSFDLMQKIMGRMPLGGITRRIILDWRDELSETPSKANNFVSHIRLLFNFAIDRSMVASNPALRIKKLKIGEHRPWTQPELDSFNESAGVQMKLAMALALYTGQRLGDVLKMRWNQITDGGIEVIQQKTGESLWIPMHSNLSAILANTPKRSVMILTGPNGTPYKSDNLKHRFKEASRAAKLPDDCVFHGLRKTATVMLAEAGCSTEQIKAITGHKTDAMVAHYAKGANQKVLAKAAIANVEKFGRQKLTN